MFFSIKAGNFHQNPVPHSGMFTSQNGAEKRPISKGFRGQIKIPTGYGEYFYTN